MNIKMNPLADIVLHVGILILVASMLIHENTEESEGDRRYAEWKIHEQNMMEREAQRERFFHRWSQALQSAECEATVIEAIKDMGPRG